MESPLGHDPIFNKYDHITCIKHHSEVSGLRIHYRCWREVLGPQYCFRCFCRWLVSGNATYHNSWLWYWVQTAGVHGSIDTPKGNFYIWPETARLRDIAWRNSPTQKPTSVESFKFQHQKTLKKTNQLHKSIRFKSGVSYADPKIQTAGGVPRKACAAAPSPGRCPIDAS